MRLHGEKLTGGDIVTRLEMSRTPVREARCSGCSPKVIGSMRPDGAVEVTERRAPDLHGVRPGDDRGHLRITTVGVGKGCRLQVGKTGAPR